MFGDPTTLLDSSCDLKKVETSCIILWRFRFSSFRRNKPTLLLLSLSEAVEVLAKPMGMGDLRALIPKELDVRETQLSEALDHVATLRAQQH